VDFLYGWCMPISIYLVGPTTCVTEYRPNNYGLALTGLQRSRGEVDYINSVYFVFALSFMLWWRDNEQRILRAPAIRGLHCQTIVQCLMLKCGQGHVIGKIHHCKFRARKRVYGNRRQKNLIYLKNSNDLLCSFPQIILFMPPNFRMTFLRFTSTRHIRGIWQIFIHWLQFFISAIVQAIITAQIAFHNCTFQVITAHQWRFYIGARGG